MEVINKKWQKFTQTGSIVDYLEYKKVSNSQLNSYRRACDINSKNGGEKIGITQGKT